MSINISMYSMAVDSFRPMLKSLSEILSKGAPALLEKGIDPANARLAPDMYSLSQQVQLACHHAREGACRLTGRESAPPAAADESVQEMEARIAATLDFLDAVPSGAFEQAEQRDCSIPLPNDGVISLNGLQFLRAWALPHFYFHVVTAYDILRNAGAQLGKQDYLSQIGPYIHPRPT